MTKYLIILVVATILGSSYMPKWWNNPHGHFLKLDQSKLFTREPTTKPDLSKIKENLYMPVEATVSGIRYRGLITVKPSVDSKPLRVTGAIYSQQNTDEVSLLEGNLIEKKNHYQIEFKSQNASKMFDSQKAYKSNTDVPISLEIRSANESAAPYLISPLDKTETQQLRFLNLHIDIEKPFIGKWKLYTAVADWEFEFSPLAEFQLSGIGSFEADKLKCKYPVWGFPVGRQQMLFLTGESSINTDSCRTYSWISTSEEAEFIVLEPYNHDGYPMTLSRQ